MVLLTQRINWDSLTFKIEAIDETKVNMIQISILFASSILDIKGGCERSNLWLCERLKWENV